MGVKGMDMKQLAMKHGERIGLGVGAGLMLLLVFWGVTSGTSTPTTKDEIAQNAQKGQSAIQSRDVVKEKLKPENVPSEAELGRRKDEFNRPIPEGAYALAHNFYARHAFDDTYKTNPPVLAPIEMVGRGINEAIRIRQIEKGLVTVLDPEKTINIKRAQKPKAKERQDAMDRFKQFGGEGAPGMGGMMGMGGGMMGMGGPGMMRGKGAFGQKPLKPEEKPKDEQPIEGQLEITPHAILKKLADLKPDDVIAETLAPLRAVYLVGTFPHKKQMQEIARALRIDEDQVPLLYQAPEIQRREVVPKNTRLPSGEFAKEDLVKVGPNRYEPLDPEKGWATLDHKWLKWLWSLTVEFEEEEDPLLKALLVGRLALPKMPKPQRGKYPDLTSELQSVQEAKDQLEKEAAKNAPPPREHPGLPRDSDPFNPEAGRGDEGTATKPGATANPPGGGGLTPIQAGSGGGKAGLDTEQPRTTGREAVAGSPTNSLIRFLDYDPQMRPGFTYEYRLRVVLHNPNYKLHTQVQDQRFAEVAELKGPWSTPNLRVTLPEEVHIYADAREGKIAERETGKAAIQLHKWLPGVRTSTDFHPVGEWWVEKLLVPRGEYIGRVNETKYIVWVSTAIDPSTNKVGVDVFKAVKHDPENLWTGSLLVDFETYARLGLVIPSGGKVNHFYPGKVTYPEDTPTEILFVDEHGRLMARQQHRDREDPERTERFARWETWKQKVMDSLKGLHKEGTGRIIKFDQ